MNLTEYRKRLQNFEDDKLIDVVKNYRQYGYSDEIRGEAIAILDERGISQEKLQMKGDFENKTYNEAQELYDSFGSNSKIAFILYTLLLLSMFVVPFLVPNSETFSFANTIVNGILVVSYSIFLIRSFLNQSKFHKTINRGNQAEDAIYVYMFLGMSFYIFMYFYFRKQMNEKMKYIQ